MLGNGGLNDAEPLLYHRLISRVRRPHAEPHRRPSVLDVSLHRAGSKACRRCAFNTTPCVRSTCGFSPHYNALDQGGRMLSRTADHLFWSYTERAVKRVRALSTQHRVRAPCFSALRSRRPHAEPHRRPSVLDVSLHRAGREHRPHAERELRTLAAAPRRQKLRAKAGRAASISELIPAFTAKYDEITPANVLDFMVRDGYNPSSIVSACCAARENARAVRGA